MVKKLRKIYLHLRDPKGPVRFEIKGLRPRDMQQGASHAIEFRYQPLDRFRSPW